MRAHPEGLSLVDLTEVSTVGSLSVPSCVLLRVKTQDDRTGYGQFPSLDRQMGSLLAGAQTCVHLLYLASLAVISEI